MADVQQQLDELWDLIMDLRADRELLFTMIAEVQQQMQMGTRRTVVKPKDRKTEPLEAGPITIEKPKPKS